MQRPCPPAEEQGHSRGLTVPEDSCEDLVPRPRLPAAQKPEQPLRQLSVTLTPGGAAGLSSRPTEQAPSPVPSISLRDHLARSDDFEATSVAGRRRVTRHIFVKCTLYFIVFLFWKLRD